MCRRTFARRRPRPLLLGHELTRYHGGHHAAELCFVCCESKRCTAEQLFWVTKHRAMNQPLDGWISQDWREVCRETVGKRATAAEAGAPAAIGSQDRMLSGRQACRCCCGCGCGCGAVVLRWCAYRGCVPVPAPDRIHAIGHICRRFQF